MPKRKTGARKKADKQKLRQKEIRKGTSEGQSLIADPCNARMECNFCLRDQKTRAFCYFCGSVQKLPQCASCGKTKCMGGDCLVKHTGSFAVGMDLIGAICDFCEAPVCHSKKCIVNHSCPCPLEGAECLECSRGVDKCGGRFFKCFSCDSWLCEEDQFEHQASCQVLESETFKCLSCNRLGSWCCLKCKISYCDSHVKNFRQPEFVKNSDWLCKKCNTPLRELAEMSVSVRTVEFGRF